MTSRIGQEVLANISYYLEKNITPMNNINKTEINTERFLKIIDNRSCLREEIRKHILNVQLIDATERDLAEFMPKSILEPMSKEQLVKVVSYYNPDDSKTSMFDNIALIEDVSYGQRGYDKNIYRLSKKLIDEFKNESAHNKQIATKCVSIAHEKLECERTGTKYVYKK
jgi:hypothetical protein